MKKDTLQRFLIKDSPVRGEIVHLNDSLSTVLEQHPYPDDIRHLLSKALTASALLTATIKIKGKLIMQFQSEGPVNLLVTKCNQDRDISGVIRWQTPLPEDSTQLLGEGQLVITVIQDQKTQPYQSIVPLKDQKIAHALEHYFEKSEQLPTRFWLQTDGQQASGLLLQQLPETNNKLGLNFHDLCKMLDSKSVKLQQDTPTLLKSLFPEHDIELFKEEKVNFKCGCSKEKMQNAILTYGEAEVNQILKEQNSLVVTCEFCNNEFDFSKEDVENLFSSQ